MGSIRKRRARVVVVEEDRISALPDALVCHILSFLPTIDAVRTTLLSTRWNKQWIFSPNLDFNYAGYLKHGRSACESFMKFVDRVLFFHGSSDIKKFSLDCDDSSRIDSVIDPYEIDFGRVDSWIGTAVSRNVVELDLRVQSFGISGERTYELPQSLFTCKTLRVLRLLSNFITNPPATGCFPSLKVLFVIVRSPKYDNTPLENLLSKCPRLEDLTIKGSLGSGRVMRKLDINISAPQLKTLTIEMCSYSMKYMPGQDDRHDFHINAPNLDNFYLMSNLLAFSFEINSNSHYKANINLCPFIIRLGLITGLLEAFSNVKQLTLSTRTLEGCQLPAFNNLKKLKLISEDQQCYYWNFLEVFIQRSPNLEDLIVEQEFFGNEKCSEQKWTPPEIVPMCLSSHLKTICIRGFKGWQVEREFAKYLLKNGKVLNKMTISTKLSTSLEELFIEFLTFERGSATCRVQFIKMEA